jgi:hypothetical protein
MTLTLKLTPDEEKRLRERAARQGQDAPPYALGLLRQGIALPRTHSSMGLEGLGADLWRNDQGDLIDAQDYVNGLRDEWDRRP